MRHATFAELEGGLFSRNRLLEHAWTDRQITRAVAEKRLHRVRRGWYVDATIWRDLWPETRHLAHVIAVARDARGAPPVFGLVSAAVLWELPLYRLSPLRVHVLVGGSDRCSAPDVMRHEGELVEADVVVRHGLSCTSLDRTIYDLARAATPEVSLSAADAALSVLAGPRRAYDEARAMQWREAMRGRLDQRGARGIRRARSIVSIADGRAQLPGESVSRLQLLRLGFATPRLQVPVPHARGDYFVDFGLDDVNAFGEFDGKTKYLDEAQRSGKTLEQVLLDEKVREDHIRGTSQRRFARWGDEHAQTAGDLGRRLALFGIRPPLQ